MADSERLRALIHHGIPPRAAQMLADQKLTDLSDVELQANESGVLSYDPDTGKVTLSGGGGSSSVAVAIFATATTANYPVADGGTDPILAASAILDTPSVATFDEDGRVVLTTSGIYLYDVSVPVQGDTDLSYAQIGTYDVAPPDEGAVTTMGQPLIGTISAEFVTAVGQPGVAVATVDGSILNLAVWAQGSTWGKGAGRLTVVKLA